MKFSVKILLERTQFYNIFNSVKADTGFIFIKNLPNASGDSTGTITIINLEKLISPAYSAHLTIAQGQHNILVSFEYESLLSDNNPQ